tara:strand:- start:2196 stop:2501 length:306 start_codon:yes stop_codon:yes gene_type:complete
VKPVDKDEFDVRNERLAVIVDRCLESEAAYKLFDMLGAVCQLDVSSRIEYMSLVRESGAYSNEEIDALERMIVTGAAQYFKDVIDQVREEQIQREIKDLIT